MTREEFGALVKIMKSVYTDTKFIPDEYAFNVWYSLLKDIDYNVAGAALQKHMSLSRYPPTIADLRCGMTDLTDDMTGMEAWAIVYKAICNSTYHAKEEFDKFPKVIQKAVGSPAQLRAWGLDENFNENVVQSNFIKNYNVALKREKEVQKLPESLRNAIEKMNTNNNLLE